MTPLALNLSFSDRKGEMKRERETETEKERQKEREGETERERCASSERTNLSKNLAIKV